MILGKVVAEKLAVEVEETGDAVDTKRLVFAEALESLKNLSANNDK
jgi:hypothetical protein